MSTIEMSAGFASNLALNVSNIGDGASVGGDPNWYPQIGLLTYSGGAADRWSSNLFIMQGSVPGTVPANYAARSSDVLIAWGTSTGQTLLTGASGGSSVSGATLNLNPGAIAASATGTATWFWFISRNPNYGTAGCQMIGSVGTIGSGADLEISSVSIVSGTLYKLSSLPIALPTQWTY